MSKEYYLTSSNKEEKINHWLNVIETFKSFKPFSLNLNRAALLVLDMQNFFLERKSHAYIPSVETIIPTVNALIDAFSKINRKIVFTRHIDCTDANSLMKKMWRDLISLDSGLSSINSRINTNKGLVFNKTKYNAFYGTGLDNHLRDNNIEQVIITGVHSHLCCESTARDAFFRDFEVFFVVDATATYSEQLHLGTLRAIAHGFGVCISSEEILNAKQN